MTISNWKLVHKATFRKRSTLLEPARRTSDFTEFTLHLFPQSTVINKTLFVMLFMMNYFQLLPRSHQYSSVFGFAKSGGLQRHCLVIPDG